MTQNKIRFERLPLFPGLALLLAAMALAALWSLSTGDVRMPWRDVLGVLFGGSPALHVDPSDAAVIWRIRMPRALSALASGAALALCGVIFQGVLLNPLAEPYTLGVASGAAFGAAVAISFGIPAVGALAFIFAMSALALVWALGRRAGRLDVSRLILAGVIVGSILSAGLTLLKAVSGDKIAAIVIWLMGSFAQSDWTTFRSSLAAALAALSCGIYYYRELDIMSSGAQGEALGIDTARARFILLAGSSLATSLVVSSFGVIGFVGLVVPHLLRISFGPKHARLIPLSLVGGAALMTAADTLAKSLNELPAGVLTVMIGGPVFCYILWRRG